MIINVNMSKPYISILKCCDILFVIFESNHDLFLEDNFDAIMIFRNLWRLLSTANSQGNVMVHSQENTVQ